MKKIIIILLVSLLLFVSSCSETTRHHRHRHGNSRINARVTVTKGHKMYKRHPGRHVGSKKFTKGYSKRNRHWQRKMKNDGKGRGSRMRKGAKL